MSVEVLRVWASLPERVFVVKEVTVAKQLELEAKRNRNEHEIRVTTEIRKKYQNRQREREVLAAGVFAAGIIGGLILTF